MSHHITCCMCQSTALSCDPCIAGNARSIDRTTVGWARSRRWVIAERCCALDVGGSRLQGRDVLLRHRLESRGAITGLLATVKSRRSRGTHPTGSTSSGSSPSLAACCSSNVMIKASLARFSFSSVSPRRGLAVGAPGSVVQGVGRHAVSSTAPTACAAVIAAAWLQFAERAHARDAHTTFLGAIFRSS